MDSRFAENQCAAPALLLCLSAHLGFYAWPHLHVHVSLSQLALRRVYKAQIFLARRLKAKHRHSAGPAVALSGRDVFAV